VSGTEVLRGTLLPIHPWGYFERLRLGLKQALMLLVLGIMGALMPTFVRIGRALAELEEDAPRLPDATRSLFARAEPYMLVMRGPGLVAVVLAVFRPVLG
jgi:hypothetical protein